MQSVTAGLLAGLGLVAAFPPRGQAWLAVPSVALFVWAIRRAPSTRVAAVTGWVFGLGFFGFLFPWLSELGVIAFVPLWLAQSLFFLLFALVVKRLQTVDPALWWVAVIGAWATVEAVRARFPLGGFEWGFLGYTAGTYTWSRQATQWIGTTGWSVLLIAVAAGLTLAAERLWRPLVASVLVAVAVTVAGGMWPATADGPEVRVVVVQGSTPCPGTHCVDERYQTYLKHLELTNSLEPGSVDLVVWAEGSTGGFDADPVLDPEVGAAMGEAARRLGAVLIAGGDRPISDTEWVNANVVFDSTGRIVGEYDKRHPVPFGEYIPARPLFEWIPELAAIPRDMVPGAGPVVFDLAIGRIGSVVSWEGSFARFVRDEVRAGAQLMVVATNQGSYPYTSASDQFIAMTRMRSAESGVDLIHAGVVGRSTIFTDSGRMGPVTGQGTSEILRGVVQLRTTGPTLYARFGDWLQLLAIAAAVGVVVRAGLRGRDRVRPTE